MKSILTQGLLLLVLIFSTLFLLRQIDWMSVLNVEKNTENMEEKLGELVWEIFETKENKNQFVINSLDSLVTKICDKNLIDRNNIKLHILNSDEINAFALPNGYLIVCTELILMTQNQEELSGVISHELAHIELNHLTQKLIKEIGLSMLMVITKGQTSPEIIKQAAKIFSSSTFDKTLEKEADLQAVDYLIKADVNPEFFANFMYQIVDRKNDITNYLLWGSTHPDSKERAKYIIEYAEGKPYQNESILTQDTWDKLKKKLQER